MSADSRDKRMRCSLYVEGTFGEKAVIDTGPEFRLQALRAGITGLDAIFLTHAHADHIHGLDDIRPLPGRAGGGFIPVYGNRGTITEFRRRFSYVFKKTQEGGGKPRIEVLAVPAGSAIRLGFLVFTPIPVKHGSLTIFGWKMAEMMPKSQSGPERYSRSAVYLTDTSFIGESAFASIAEGGKPSLLIIGALRKQLHATHFSFEQAFEAAFRIGAEKTFLTHLCHEHSHHEIEGLCRIFTQKTGFPGVILPAWDGLEIKTKDI
jgi:phosphoribosyl 1,2-cyclic phosphate phosphodiesterase